jgi:hypothetical protein
MKKRTKLLGIIAIGAIIAVSTLALAGCDNGSTNSDQNTPPSDNTPTTGTIIVKNEEREYSIRHVTILDKETNSYIVDERVAIGINGGSQSFTVPPGKYIVTIQDDDADWYAINGSYYSLSSLQVAVTAGTTKTVIYNTDRNRDNLIVQ